MANWKKVIVSGSIPSFTDIKIDGLASNTVVLGGGSGSVLTTQARNGTGNIVGTTAATGLSHSGSFSGSFQGTINADIASASIADTAGTASVALRANSLAPTVTATSASVAARATTLSPAATASFADLASAARTSTSASIATTAGTASVAVRATTLSAAATASYALLASDARTATSASIATLASTLSPTATASYGDGLFSGSFSGSYQGDGSNLTGLATTLTVDGDSGAQDVSLTEDDLQILGTAQEITTAVTKVGNDVKVTLSLPDDVTIGNNLTVTNDATIAGDLVVGGSIVSASSLAVEDQFIILASGSNGAIDGGIIINQIDDDPDGKGQAFAYDSSANRWALETGLNDSASVITPDAYMGVIQEASGVPSSNPLYGGTAGKGTIYVNTGNDDIYIYS
mgnify:CR=1 FL=1